ncbi:hydrogenase nickel incorporation protein HypB [Alteromonas facilis]|uniref:hydrogenase nickel incorporation protein HypB n=1 Tax=Alteromonas facilis TaxID=2048004 RepID=UPI000C292D88|nr:hydrogenase nickel incorporation protein HypB [Alteromonas facilis]
MCTHCGCSSDKASVVNPGSGQIPETITRKESAHTLHLQQAILDGNDDIAARTRHHFQHQQVVCINVMGTPGAGKTHLLETLLRNAYFDNERVAVLEGDQNSNNDAQRIINAGGKALQINTGTGCHLDAEMISVGVETLALTTDSLLFVENVGNLVCPALFDLGESARIAIMAVTDGEDKPVKYPHMFSQCDLVLINKSDLLPYVDFNVEKVIHDISHLNPGCPVLLVSAKTGEGVDAVAKWILERTPHDQAIHTAQ